MKRLFKFICAILLILSGLWLAKQMLPPAAPFLLSLVAAAVMNPIITALEQKGVPRSLGAGVVTAIILLLSAGILTACAAGGAQLLTDYARKAPIILTVLTNSANAAQQHLTSLLNALPQNTAAQLSAMAQSLTEQLSDLPLWLSRKALDGVTVFAKASPDWLLFICTAIIGIYFFSLYFRDILSFFRRQLSEDALAKLQLVRSVTIGAAGGYLKVQCIISGVTFLILLAAFTVMDIDAKPTAALGIAVIDALPILGAGAVLIPWALIALALGNVRRAVGLAVVYGVLLVTHNLLQAKLMGSHLGLHPVTALVSLYAGWKLGGLAGMILLPIGCVLLCALNDADIIRVYK